MANLNDIKLSAQDILKKQFRSKVKGYDPDEVDAYLDQVISDYETFQQLIEDLYGQIGTLQRQLMDEKQKEKKTVAAERKDEEKLKTYTPSHRRSEAVSNFLLICSALRFISSLEPTPLIMVVISFVTLIVSACPNISNVVSCKFTSNSSDTK